MTEMEICKDIVKSCVKKPWELRKAYEMLEDMKDSKMSIHRNMMVALKQRIREVARKIEDPLTNDERVYQADFDGYIEGFYLNAETKEDAEKEFMEMHYIQPTYSWYDCTGKPFTSSHEIVKKHGRWFAIHRVGFDV